MVLLSFLQRQAITSLCSATCVRCSVLPVPFKKERLYPDLAYYLIFKTKKIRTCFKCDQQEQNTLHKKRISAVKKRMGKLVVANFAMIVMDFVAPCASIDV